MWPLFFFSCDASRSQSRLPLPCVLLVSGYWLAERGRGLIFCMGAIVRLLASLRLDDGRIGSNPFLLMPTDLLAFCRGTAVVAGAWLQRGGYSCWYRQRACHFFLGRPSRHFFCRVTFDSPESQRDDVGATPYPLSRPPAHALRATLTMARSQSFWITVSGWLIGPWEVCSCTQRLCRHPPLFPIAWHVPVGTGFIKAGFAEDPGPRTNFPTVVGRRMGEDQANFLGQKEYGRGSRGVG